MFRTHTATQHGHSLSRVAGACPVPFASVPALSSPVLVDAAYPQTIQRPESTIEWLMGAVNLFDGKREQRTAIT